MKHWFKKFWNDEEGLGTLEMLLIAAVLIGIALLFRKAITGWVNDLIKGGDSGVKQGSKIEGVESAE